MARIWQAEFRYDSFLAVSLSGRLALGKPQKKGEFLVMMGQGSGNPKNLDGKRQ